MSKLFNITGPCIASKHYMLPSIERIAEAHDLIENGDYFVIHSSRQSGKTTFLKSMVKDINSKDDYYAVYVSLEKLQNINDAQKGIEAIHKALVISFDLADLFNFDKFIDNLDYVDYSNILEWTLTKLTKSLDKPLIIFFDEADCLSYNVLIPFLRQLRSGYINRDEYSFVHSLALVGMRRIKDYKADVRPDTVSSGTSSPFNISAGNFTLENFTLDEVTALYNQHTQTTGQQFTKDAIERAHYYSGGQPWLVNAIARECVIGIHKKVYEEDVTIENIETAVQTLILRRDTHFDSLFERLKEDRVRKIVEPVILGQGELKYKSDDFHYVIDLGLLKDDKGYVSPANPMYKEVLLRELSFESQNALPITLINKWLTPTGIDMSHLLVEFQKFWRENSDIWIERYQYKEAAPHLILQAFLQRVINGGGNIQREYASGRGRMDLCVEYLNYKYPIELKLLYGDKTLSEGLDQISGYMDTVGEKEGWLIIFDRKTDKNWEEKIYWNTKEIKGKTIHVVGG